MYGVGFSHIYNDIQKKGADLPDHGGDGRAGDAQRREAEEPEDEDRVQDDIDHTAGDEEQHGDLHFADALEDLLKGDLEQRAE